MTALDDLKAKLAAGELTREHLTASLRGASAADRLLENSIPEPMSGCWIWTAAASKGYGSLSIFGASQRAHRAAWVMRNGRIPAGLQVLHACDVRCCVNPDHLFVGTHTDNMRDSARKGRSIWARKTHCKNGHPYDEANTILLARGSEGRYHRTCRECRRLACRRYYDKHLRRTTDDEG